MALTAAPLSRTITLTEDVLIAGSALVPVEPSWPAKDPTEFLIYGADFRRLVERAATISAVQCAVLGGVATVGQVSFQGTVALLELGGGSLGVASVTIAVQMSTGEVIVRTVLLPIVAQLGAALIPPFGGLPVVPSGFRLTDPLTGLTLIDPTTGLPLTLTAGPGATVQVANAASGAGYPTAVTLPSGSTGTVASTSPYAQATAAQPATTQYTSTLWNFTAGANISGERALMFNPNGTVQHADPTQPSYQFAGISTQAAALGSSLVVCELGPLSDPIWSWVPGQSIYPSPDGVLTQTVPTTGILQRIAHAVSATEIVVQPHTPVTLA